MLDKNSKEYKLMEKEVNYLIAQKKLYIEYLARRTANLLKKNYEIYKNSYEHSLNTVINDANDVFSLSDIEKTKCKKLVNKYLKELYKLEIVNEDVLEFNIIGSNIRKDIKNEK